VVYIYGIYIYVYVIYIYMTKSYFACSCLLVVIFTQKSYIAITVIIHF
jgi:hypothetical protein